MWTNIDTVHIINLNTFLIEPRTRWHISLKSVSVKDWRHLKMHCAACIKNTSYRGLVMISDDFFFFPTVFHCNWTLKYIFSTREMSHTAVKHLYLFIYFYWVGVTACKSLNYNSGFVLCFVLWDKTHFWLDWCYVLNPDMYTLTCLTVYGSLYWYFFPL